MVKKPNCFFEKSIFQRVSRIILGPSKHVLHLVWRAPAQIHIFTLYPGPKFTQPTFTQNPQLHNTKFTRDPNLHEPIFSQPQIYTTRFYTNPNIHSHKITPNPNFHSPKFTQIPILHNQRTHFFPSLIFGCPDFDPRTKLSGFFYCSNGLLVLNNLVGFF